MRKSKKDRCLGNNTSLEDTLIYLNKGNNIYNKDKRKKVYNYCIDCGYNYSIDIQFCPKCHGKLFPVPYED